MTARALLLVAPLLHGCWAPCSGDGCPPPEPVAEGVWVLDTEAPDSQITEGTLDVAGDTVVFEYTDLNGDRWRATFDVVARTPDPAQSE